jgi:hypothetical protein
MIAMSEKRRKFIMTLKVAAQASEGRLSASSAAQLDAGTQQLIEAPITATLLRLAAPNMLVMVAQVTQSLHAP